MRSKLIFLDIDGTLVGFDGKMPESTRAVLGRAVEKGHHLIVSTGRLAAQVYPWLFEKAIFDGFISSSGANIKWKGEQVACNFWSHDQVKRFCEAAASVGAAVFGHTETNLIAEPGAVEHQVSFFAKFGLERWQFQSLLDNVLVADPCGYPNIEKGIYIDSGHSVAEMQALLGDEFKVDGYSFGPIPPTSGEVTLAGVSKASAIEVLCDYLGVGIEDTVAIGDGSNDIEMVKRAGCGIAMGNGVEELKAVADHVCGRIEEDGLAAAFERWIL